MSKRTNQPVTVEIDQDYEQRMTALDRVDGHVSDYPIVEARPQRPAQRQALVLPERPAVTARAMTATEIAAMNQASHVLDVSPTATQHIEVRTSSVDRAKGFLIANVPLFAAFAVGIVLVSIIGFDVPFLSIPTLVIFWLSFVGAWLISYVYTLTISAEGVAHYEARQKWNVIKNEQKERWAHYKRLTGSQREPDNGH